VCIAVNCSWSFVYCVIILRVLLLPHVYCFTVCVLLPYVLYLPNCWLEVSTWKVLRPATSLQVFLGFRVFKSKCWDGSQDSIATACFSCSPPDLNFLDPCFIFMYTHNDHCHRAIAHLQLNILLSLLLYYVVYKSCSLPCEVPGPTAQACKWYNI